MSGSKNKCEDCGKTFVDAEKDWRDDDDGQTLICPHCGSENVV